MSMVKTHDVKAGKYSHTRNDLSESIKKETIKTLNQLVADFGSLAFMTKQAHWNMKGPNFIAVHEMLDEFRDSILDHQDTFAERIVQLAKNAVNPPPMRAGI